MNPITQVQSLKSPKQLIMPVLEAYLGNLPEGLKTPFFSAKEKEFYPVTLNGAHYFFIGLGEKTAPAMLQQIARSFSYQFRKKLNTEDITLSIPEEWDENQVKGFLLGLFLGAYQIKPENQHPFWHGKVSLFLHQQNSSLNLKKIAEEAQHITAGQFTCMDWLNKPANEKNAEKVADFSQKLASENGFKCTVLNRDDAKKKGLNAFLAVNQGSAHGAAFIVLEYIPKQKNVKKVGLIGKCVTFDTGGISIKPSQNLHYMKSDMGGATAVLGTFEAVAKLQLPVHLVGILPATDNAVNNSSYLPSDVIGSYSGKTIEIIDTDAEGRLTLADALSYMVKNHTPDVMIDLATLTGSAVRTFGYHCAALFTKNSLLEQQLMAAGEATAQKTWPLPMWDEYKDHLKSDIADIKNFSGNPVSGAIDAAVFLGLFTENHSAWAHLDIAGVAFGNNEYAKDKSATGYGVQLLVEFLKSL